MQGNLAQNYLVILVLRHLLQEIQYYDHLDDRCAFLKVLQKNFKIAETHFKLFTV